MEMVTDAYLEWQERSYAAWKRLYQAAMSLGVETLRTVGNVSQPEVDAALRELSAAAKEYADAIAKKHQESHKKSDGADVLCPNGHTMIWRPECRHWTCHCGANPITEHEAAWHRLGPFARPVAQGADYGPPIPGFIQVAPNQYERIVDPDFKAAYAADMQATADLVRKGKF